MRTCNNGTLLYKCVYDLFKILLVFFPLIVKSQTNTFPSTGNVGIGTTNPQKTLEVMGNGYFSNEVFSSGGFRVSSAYGDNTNGSPWYGLGISNLKLGDHEAVQLAGFWGLNLQTSLGQIAIGQNGNVGIGTSNPYSRLHMIGDTYLTIGDFGSSMGTKGIRFTGWRDILDNYLGASIEAVPSWRCCNGYPQSGGYPGIKDMQLEFKVHNNQDEPNDMITAMTILANANVGIGTNLANEKLTVNGTVRAREVKVDASPWPDYVFTNSYVPITLDSLEKQLRKDGHLAGMPSAKEVAQEGISIGRFNRTILERLEELTLYVIELKKENIELRSKIDKIRKK